MIETLHGQWYDLDRAQLHGRVGRFLGKRVDIGNELTLSVEDSDGWSINSNYRYNDYETNRLANHTITKDHNVCRIQLQKHSKGFDLLIYKLETPIQRYMDL